MGEVFGQYELLTKIGRGGMGQVWRANDTAHDRQVAIKVLAPELAADSTYRARFLREARTVAKLQHPNIVFVHAFGEIDGRLFIAMPLLNGQDLDTLICQEGPLPLSRAVQVIGQVAAALDVAHESGLVHRDVKPSNIFILPSGHVYLIDFGIAHTDGDDGLTSGTHPIGTAAYMAPERYDGNAGPGVDIYALTCVLYECLTGRRPFEGATIAQQIAAHLTKPPPLPTRLVPSLPAILDKIIARGMAKDPADRYPTASALAQALPTPTVDVTAMVELGDLLSGKEPPDLEGARHWYEQAAGAGNTDAMNNLGHLLAYRLDPPNTDGARYWLAEAASAGDTDAMVRLGNLFYERRPRDFDTARFWYERAATAGDTAGMYNLGNMLAYDLDPPDLDGARKCYEQGAALGDVDAMLSLGTLLEEDFIPPDLTGARHWYERALAAGYDVQDRLVGLLTKLNSAASLRYPDADAIQAAWQEISAQVRERSRTVHVMLTGATIRNVDGNRLVLGHDSAPLVRRLAEARNAKVIADAMHAVFGKEFAVTCVNGTRPNSIHRLDGVENRLARLSELSESERADLKLDLIGIFEAADKDSDLEIMKSVLNYLEHVNEFEDQLPELDHEEQNVPEEIDSYSVQEVDGVEDRLARLKSLSESERADLKRDLVEIFEAADKDDNLELMEIALGQMEHVVDFEQQRAESGEQT